MIELTHPFIRRCLDRRALLGINKTSKNKVYKFNTFASRLEKQAKQYGGSNEEQRNTYKGWGFELFGEMLVKTHAFDKRIGVNNYQIVEEDEDVGVDGHGIGSDGLPATVQFKYRQANYILTNEDHLTNFTYNSERLFDAERRNMLIITSGKGLNVLTHQNMLGKEIRCIGREKIRVLVDNQIPFWDEFRKAWECALQQNSTPLLKIE